ncbi:MAG: bifunctional hydroxymethylpyrimidine kinase/phosphomethylpyrimidine kinase [Terrimicrobiaceae bacterium]
MTKNVGKGRPGSPRQRNPALSIAGSDNSAGAGIQADLKTFCAHGCYGLTAVTCVVSEVPGLVSAIQPVRGSLVQNQIELCLQAFPVRAVKTGMLYSTEIVRAVARALQGQGIPIVVDPVMMASSGAPLLKPSAVAAYRKLLFPMATLVTPNLDELSLLANRPIPNLRVMRDAGMELAETLGCSLLLKGGHLKGRRAVDVLVSPEGVDEYSEDFIKNVSTHGTGCTYSAAITANLANGKSLRESVAAAKTYVTAAIRHHLRWPNTQALDHFSSQRRELTPSDPAHPAGRPRGNSAPAAPVPSSRRETPPATNEF